MERFVFVAAVTFAIIFGVAAVFGHDHMNLEFNGGTDPVVEVAAGRLEAQAFQGDELRISHIAARVTITPEDRQDYSIEIDNPGRAPMPTITIEHGRVLVDGHVRGRVRECRDNGDVELRGYGDLALADLPQVIVHAPRNVDVSIGSGSTTEIGASEALNLDFSGCGTANLGDVAGALTLDLAGSGQIRGGSARSVNADIAGSGDVSLGAIADSASVDIAGSGSITMASLTGSLDTDGAGSGAVQVQSGAVTTAKIELAGSGGVTIAAPVQHLDVSLMGSSDVDVQGEVGDLDAEVAGSGEVSVYAVTGSQHQSVLGSGGVRIERPAAPAAATQNAP